MSDDRPVKRKSATKNTIDAPPPPPRKKATAKKSSDKRRTADNLEALIDLIDKEDSPPKTPAAKRESPNAAAAPKPVERTQATPPLATPVAASSFMQELASAKAALHKERRARTESEEKASALQSELQQLAAKYQSLKVGSKVDSEALTSQLDAVERQRKKLAAANTELQSELAAAQAARKQLDKRLVDQGAKLAGEAKIVAELRSELAASREDGLAKKKTFDVLQKELAQAVAECKDLRSERSAQQAATEQLAIEAEGLRKSLADTRAKLSDRDESLSKMAAEVKVAQTEVETLMSQLSEAQQTSEQRDRELSEQIAAQAKEMNKIGVDHTAVKAERDRLANDLKDKVTELETLKQETGQLKGLISESQTKLDEAVAAHESLQLRSEQSQQESAAKIKALDEQLVAANEQVSKTTATLKELKSELTDEKHEKRKAIVTRDELIEANERLEERVRQLTSDADAKQREQGKDDSKAVQQRLERLEQDVARSRMDLADAYEQLGAARLRLANSDRDRDHALRREQDAARRVNELEDEVKSLNAAAQREAASRRKAEAVSRREPNETDASALYEAERKIERLSNELAASKGVEAAYQQKAVRKVQQAKQELEALRARLAELESADSTDE